MQSHTVTGTTCVLVPRCYYATAKRYGVVGTITHPPLRLLHCKSQTQTTYVSLMGSFPSCTAPAKCTPPVKLVALILSAVLLMQLQTFQYLVPTLSSVGLRSLGCQCTLPPFCLFWFYSARGFRRLSDYLIRFWCLYSAEPFCHTTTVSTLSNSVVP